MGLVIVFGVLFSLCCTAEGGGRVTAFMAAGGIGRPRLHSAGVRVAPDQSTVSLHSAVSRDRAILPPSVSLNAQLPGLRGEAGRLAHVRSQIHTSFGIPPAQGRPSGRTMLSASTFSGGRSATDGDDYHYPEGSTRFIAECDLPTDRGNFRMRAYTYRGAKVVVRDGENVLEWTEMEPVIIYKGNLRGSSRVVVRVHDQCYTSEVLGSKRCDCREQLELALDYINQHGGALIYMPQEGRGIGLANKIAAYQLQDGGLDTVDANRALGFGDDERCYACVPFMLKDMGIKDIRLMTNNPFKIRQLSELGVNIVGAKSHVVPSNEFNAKYLRTKAARMAHVLPDLDASAADARATPPPRPQDGTAARAADGGAAARWRFGKKSVEAAAKALASGSAVVMVDGKRRNEGWLVAGAQGVSTGTLGLLSQLGDAISVPVAEEVLEAVNAGRAGGGGGDDAEGGEEQGPGKGRLMEGRVALLRRLAAAAQHAQATAIRESLPSPLATVLGGGAGGAASELAPCTGLQSAGAWKTARDACLPQRLLPLCAKPGSLDAPTRSPGDAAVALAGLARQAPVVAMSPILTHERLDLMSFAQVCDGLALL